VGKKNDDGLLCVEKIIHHIGDLCLSDTVISYASNFELDRLARSASIVGQAAGFPERSERRRRGGWER
jgi:hypothetical protein